MTDSNTPTPPDEPSPELVKARTRIKNHEDMLYIVLTAVGILLLFGFFSFACVSRTDTKYFTSSSSPQILCGHEVKIRLVPRPMPTISCFSRRSGPDFTPTIIVTSQNPLAAKDWSDGVEIFNARIEIADSGDTLPLEIASQEFRISSRPSVADKLLVIFERVDWGEFEVGQKFTLSFDLELPSVDEHCNLSVSIPFVADRYRNSRVVDITFFMV